MVFPTFYFQMVSKEQTINIMKNFAVYILPIWIGLFLVSCSYTSDCDCDNPPDLRSITAEEEIVIASANDFAFDILTRINDSEEEKNLFISPLSISTALSMTANGAVGDTKDGIKTTLHLEGLTDQVVNEAYKTLVEFITELDPKVNMSLANSNWYKEEYHIEDAFRTLLHEYYNAEVNAADFSNPATKDLINGWIEDKTNGKIKDMLDQIPANAVMYLINAIYLKATWQYQFEKNKTEQRAFTLMNGTTKQTDMMYSKGVKANYFGNEDMQLIELPYGNGQFVFSIILPKAPAMLNEIIASVNSDLLDSYLEQADTSTFEVYLPKFKIEYKILLNEVLAQMGMANSFNGTADFSDLFIEELDLFISRVLHQSFIEVDEEGTEAAAVTIVEIVETSAGPNGTPSVLYIDRPFAFFIREKHSKSILFAGKLIDPTM